MRSLLLLVVAVSTASAASLYGSIPSLPGIVCQLFLGGVPLCPGSSCKDIAETRLWSSRSGLHWLTSKSQTPVQAQCEESIPPSESRGWMKVGYVTSNSSCPEGLEALTAGGRKLCRKTVGIGCSSVTFPAHGVSYSKVCGRVYGYQKDTPDGFYRSTRCPGCTIDQPYIDGVSITHGSPRQHIWTLAATRRVSKCPCPTGHNFDHFPQYVGDDYYCDVEGTSTYNYTDRLWDGSGCLSGAEQCCDRANWFCKDLPQPTTDDIEFRVCADEPRANEDVYIEDIEIYVQ